MIHTILYKSGLHTLFFKIFGAERSIQTLIKEIDIPTMGTLILDVGCGTGTIGLNLLKRLPGSSLTATDIDKKFLKQTIKNCLRMQIDESRLRLGISDINLPKQIHLTTGSSLLLEDYSFDLVCASGVIGYSNDQKKTIKTLLGLVKYGGCFINLEMKETRFGKMISRLYKYPIISHAEIISIIEKEGFQVIFHTLTQKHFPLNLTRIVIIGTKTGI